jgi:hypothetical protein
LAAADDVVGALLVVAFVVVGCAVVVVAVVVAAVDVLALSIRARICEIIRRNDTTTMIDVTLSARHWQLALDEVHSTQYIQSTLNTQQQKRRAFTAH